MAHLEVQYTDGRRMRFPLAATETILGRDASCDIALQDGIASRRHALIRRDGQGGFWIEDLKSKNGIVLNDRPVTTASVRHGDRIGIGTCQLTLFSDPQPTVLLQDTPSDTLPGAASAWRGEDGLDLSRKRLETLYGLNERLAGHLDRDELLGTWLDVCFEQFRFERAGVAVWRGKPHGPQWIHLRDRSSDLAGEFRISRSVVDRALDHAERTLINDTADGQIDPTASMISNDIRSAMCVPMEFLDQVHGVIYGDRVTSTGGYSKEDIDFFAALGRLGAMGLANVELFEARQKRHKAEIQLQLARDIQARLFPDEALEDEGLHIDALNDPGQMVSGDYYDFFRREDGLVAIVIADVAGKGVPAARLMANLQAAVRIMLSTQTDLLQTVGDINRLLCANIADSRFITAIFGLLDPAARRLSFVNAGHLAPYLIHDDDRLEQLTIEPSLPIGINADYPYELGEIALPSNPSTLILHTDGVPDAENEQGERYQEHRFAAALESNIAEQPGELVTKIRRSIKQFTRNHPQTDDITLMAIRLE